MRKTKIGGQAVIEGVMMKGPRSMAMAIRKSDGTIEVVKKPSVPLSQRHPLLKLPIIRGMASFVDSLVTGMTSLTDSAKIYGEGLEEEYKPSRFERFLSEKTGMSADDIGIAFAVIIAVVLAVAFFVLLPTYVAGLLQQAITSPLALNLIEGVIRIALFLGYMLLVTRMRDIQRVFEYHGAEHKVIHCFEHEEELTVENARKYTTLHPRCGTNFLLLVLVVSIVLFSFLGWGNILWRTVWRLLLLPVVAGLAYELIRWAGSSDALIVRIISWPGLMLQKLTTRQPDDQQLEVAIAAFNGVADGEGDIWM